VTRTIVAAFDNRSHPFGYEIKFTAVCDDGSIWTCDGGVGEPQWRNTSRDAPWRAWDHFPTTNEEAEARMQEQLRATQERAP
jgi:hypothetical protein